MIQVREAFSDSNRLATQGQLCSICGAPLQAGNRVIDTGTWIEMEGTFEFCESCFGEMAKQLGWVSPDRFQALWSDYEDAIVLVNDAEARVEQQQTVIQTLAEEVAFAALERASRFDPESAVEVSEEPDFDGAPNAA